MKHRQRRRRRLAPNPLLNWHAERAIREALPAIGRELGVDFHLAEERSGAYGLVYFPEGSDDVIKVTVDSSERDTALTLRSLPERDSEGAARVYEVFDVALQVPDEATGETIDATVIVMERVGLPGRERMTERELEEFDRGIALVQAAGMAGSAYYQAKDILERVEAEDRMRRVVWWLSDVGPEWKPIGRTLYAMLRAGRPLVDRHQRNIGVRDDGVYVAIDYGGSEYWQEKKVGPWGRLIANGRLRENAAVIEPHGFNDVWYHGTHGDDVARRILETGVLEPLPPVDRYTQHPDARPLPDRVYLTTSPDMAIAYSTENGSRRHQESWIFLVEGPIVGDADEDEVTFAFTAGLIEHLEVANRIYWSAPQWLREQTVEPGPDTHEEAEASSRAPRDWHRYVKQVLVGLTPEESAEIERETSEGAGRQAVSAFAPVAVVGGWRYRGSPQSLVDWSMDPSELARMGWEWHPVQLRRNAPGRDPEVEEWIAWAREQERDYRETLEEILESDGGVVIRSERLGSIKALYWSTRPDCGLQLTTFSDDGEPWGHICFDDLDHFWSSRLDSIPWLPQIDEPRGLGWRDRQTLLPMSQYVMNGRLGRNGSQLRFDPRELGLVGDPTYEHFDVDDEAREVAENYPQTRRVRRVRWGFQPGVMMRVKAEQVVPVIGQQWGPDQLATVLDAIERSDEITLRPAAARVHLLGDSHVEESEDYLSDNMTRPWDAEDVGQPYAVLVDGNHRAFAALLSGEPYIWVYVGEDYRDDVADLLE